MTGPDVHGTEPAGPSVWGGIAEHLRDYGVSDVFGIPGDDMAQLVAFAAAGITVHSATDQRHSVYQAVAYARVSHRLGVCFVGKGPAVTHAATGVLEAQSMRVPLLVLTSGVPAAELGTGAFQELDAVAVLAPIAKATARVSDGGSVLTELAAAIRLARSGAPGPVCLEIPEGLTLTPSTASEPLPVVALDLAAGPVPADPGPVNRSERPVVLVGGGCAAEGIGALVVELADRIGAGILATASGRGVVDEDHPRFLGLTGLYAAAPAVQALAEADLVLSLGSRLEETATYGWPDPPPTLYQVNTAATDLSPTFAGPTVVDDVAAVLAGWLAGPNALADIDRSAWRERLATAGRGVRADRAEAEPIAGRPRVASVLHQLDAVLPPDRVSVHENGLQDMWSYFFPHWTVRGGADCLVPSEQTPLGFGFGGARGAALAAGGRPVVVIGGDGAFRSAASELADLAALDHPVLLVVLVNGGFGWLESNLRVAAPPSVASRYSFVNRQRPIAGLCRAYDLPHVRCQEATAVVEAVAQAWRACSTGRPAVLEVEVSLADAPPGMDELVGDFPVERAVSEAQR